MFCGNCGKEIIGDTKFCPFCGAEQTAVVIPAASIPASMPAGEYADTSALSAPEAQSVLSVPITSGAPSESTSAASVTAVSTAVIAPAAAPSVPMPNTIPTSNIGLPDTAAPAAPSQASPVQAAPSQAAPVQAAAGVAPHPVITVNDEEKPAPERKYSLKHIVMCLAAAAVMAVAAGVFAGLYFSVIFTN